MFETSEEATEAEAILHDLEKTLSFDFRPYDSKLFLWTKVNILLYFITLSLKIVKFCQRFKLPDADEVAYPDCAKHETREQRFSKAKQRVAIDIDQPRMLDLGDLPLMPISDA